MVTEKKKCARLGPDKTGPVFSILDKTLERLEECLSILSPLKDGCVDCVR